MLSTVRWPEPALSEAEGFRPGFCGLPGESRPVWVNPSLRQKPTRT